MEGIEGQIQLEGIRRLDHYAINETYWSRLIGSVSDGAYVYLMLSEHVAGLGISVVGYGKLCHFRGEIG